MSALPELVTTKLPQGSHAAISKACARHGITPAQYVRAAVWERLVADRLSTAALDTIAPRLRLPPETVAA